MLLVILVISLISKNESEISIAKVQQKQDIQKEKMRFNLHFLRETRKTITIVNQH